MLKLKIENYDRLPTGGPLEYQVDRRGFDLGRDQHLDWALPDNSRVISGKHCEVRYHDNAYWLSDLSTNGTFLNGNSKRMQSPYRLRDGDKLNIGDYIIAVSLADSVPSFAEAPMPVVAVEYASAPPRAVENIWDAPHAAPPPIDPRSLMPRQPEHERAPDFLSQAANIPSVFDTDSFRKPAPAAPAQPVPVSAPPTRPPTGNYIERFAKGAGLSPDVLAGTDAGDLAELTGQLLNLTCQNVMGLLHARAEAKALSRSGSRTMIQSTDNNPLKFTPTPEEALRLMLGPKTKGYLDAQQALDSSFSDLKIHQMTTLAAMQTAVTKLLEGLSPEVIAKSAENRKSLLAGAKGKQWDSFVEIWSRKTEGQEHGMLGAFLLLFAEHYEKLSKSPR